MAANLEDAQLNKQHTELRICERGDTNGCQADHTLEKSKYTVLQSAFFPLFYRLNSSATATPTQFQKIPAKAGMQVTLTGGLQLKRNLQNKPSE